VVSLCLSDDWQRATRVRVSNIVPTSWFRPLEARIANILTTDMSDVLAGANRVLVLWDAHGYAVAGCVLGSILPMLRDRPHVVLIHDISDARYTSPPFDYGGQSLWAGGVDGEGPRLLLGHLSSAVEQAVSILDFTSRNQLPLHSCEESLHGELSAPQVAELQGRLGELFSQIGHWCWLSLNEMPSDRPVYFPRFTPETEGEFDPYGPLLATTENIIQLQRLIRDMERSSIWKVRNLLLPLRQSVRLFPRSRGSKSRDT